MNEILTEITESLGIEYTIKDDILIVGSSAFIYRDLFEADSCSTKGHSNTLMKEFRSNGISLYQLTSGISAVKMREFIKSKIYSREKLYARNCKVVELSKEQYSDFGKYHIQGPANSSIRYGLEHDGELVGAIGLIKEGDHFNLNRMIFGKYRVVGGASKLFKHASVGIDNIITYSNNGYSDGNVYSALGFKNVNEVESDMWYVKNGQLLNRRSYQKKKLPSILSNYNESLTEVQNMINNGYSVYYGPGTIKWKWERRD